METQNRETIIIQNQSNGAATTALVLGIIGFIVGLIPYLGWFMAPVWLLAVIFGLIGMRKKYKRGTAIIGLIFGILGAAYKIGFWIVAAGGILAASYTLSGGTDYADSGTVNSTEVKVGDVAPDFNLTDMDGNQHRLSDYKGKAVYLYFWGTWAPPSKNEMPDINKQYHQFKDQGVQVFAVNAGESDSAVNQFASNYKLDFPMMIDTGREVMHSYGIVPLPTTVLINPDGKIVDIVTSALTEKTIKEHMNEIKP